MPNLFFQGAQIAMSSGTSNGVYANIQRVQDVTVNYQIPRTDVKVIGSFAPLPTRPVINYTPVTMRTTYYEGNKDVERCLGIANSTGVAYLIGQNTDVSTWGARTYQIYNAPVNSTNYAGEYDVVSGVLKTFSLAGTVGEAVKGTFDVEGLDLQQVANNNAQIIPSYNSNLIKSENITITGINFTGLGYSGLIIQSFNFQTTFNYASTFRIGTKYPERRMTDAISSLQLVGFLEGTTNTVTGLNMFDCGTFITGIYSLTLQPSCSSESPTVITMFYPYLESQAIGAQVGNFTQVTVTLSTPLSIVANEIVGVQRSNTTIT